MKQPLLKMTVAVLLCPMLLGEHQVNAIEQSNELPTEQISTDKKVDRSGLIGYYFEKNNFSKPIVVAPSSEESLFFEESELVSKESTYQSFRWLGSIVPKQTQDVTLSLQGDPGAIIKLDGKIVTQKGQAKRVYLEKDKAVAIRIESISPKKLTSSDVNKFKLISTDTSGEVTMLSKGQLRNPENSNEKWKAKIIEQDHQNLFKVKSDEPENDLDSDDDGIYDEWEIGGYTIKDHLLVGWEDKFAKLGYKKYLSNPFRSHTVADPYDDFEKASKDIPNSNAPETMNPLVAAYPSINVNLEKVIVSNNQDLSNSVGSSESTNWSYSNTVGVEAHAGWSGLGPDVGLSVNYSHSNTTGNEFGSTKEQTSHLNTAQAGYLNANVRYNNVGTGAVFEVRPTTSFVLGDDTIGTIKAKENTIASGIKPNESYPKKGQHGIAINTMDDFNSHPILLNKDQLADYVHDRKAILLETNQVDGKYAVHNASGQTVIGGDWNGITEEIESRTAAIIVDSGDAVSEKRVAGKDYTDPEDRTPEVTLKEALKIAYPKEITEKDGVLSYNDRPMNEEAILGFIDPFTRDEIQKQLDDKTGVFKDVHKLYDVKLTPKMNFTLKTSIFYDGAEQEQVPKFWESTMHINHDENTGKGAYESELLNPVMNIYNKETGLPIQKKLKKNTDYYLSVYVKGVLIGNKMPKLTIEVLGQIDDTIINKPIAKKSVELTDQYQRVIIPFSNSEGSKLQKIKFNSGLLTMINWDDVSIIEGKKSTVDESQVKGAYQHDSMKISYRDSHFILDEINYAGNVQETMGNLVDSYRVDDMHKSVTIKAPAYNSDGSVKLKIPKTFIISSNIITCHVILKDGREFRISQEVR